ncbi:MAG: hypothetical protein LBF22_01115 [Deltaproteobacteria bacterium]|jgi:cytochrome c biogenesis protein ResB|nr:hypothetical protein [Deltaproteobacteria bacterium]
MVNLLLKLIKPIWDFFASTKLAIVLSFLLALVAGLAYPLIKMNLSTFIPLGEVGLFTWLSTYGRYNLGHTFWFFALLILLTILAINTFVCSTDKLYRSLKQFPQKERLSWFLKLGPHVMHYAVLVILIGYLGSYALSESLPGRALSPDGPPVRLPRGQGEVSLTRDIPKIYSGTRLEYFDKYYLDPGYVLVFKDNSGKIKRAKLAYSVSPYYKGYRFYLADFYPKKSTGSAMGLNYIKMNIRRDPSALIYVGGIILFVVGLVLYSLETFGHLLKRKALHTED